jgi:hypothetical protein
MTRDGNPVANASQWNELLRLVFRVGKRVELRWVKGHRKSAHNKAADRLAKASANQRTGRHLSIVKVRRKGTLQSVEPGCVEMQGQRVTVKVITDEYLPVQRMNKYKYEVLSRASEFRGKVDIVYSGPDLHLSAGHVYYVRFNEDARAPRIVRVYREITA